MGKSSLAPGFRFKPTDVELVKFYLKRKLMGKSFHLKVIGELDIYKYEPWDLPDKSCWETGDLKWYFFCPREKRYQNGTKMKRATQGGYWKTTGKDRSVFYSGEVVGWIKTLVFHVGRAPGDRTDWVMHEYRLVDQTLANRGVSLDSYVLCIIFQKEGLGPRNGAQYGVPFKEEDWSDDDFEIGSEVQDGSIPKPVLRLPCTYSNLIANANSLDVGTDSAAGQDADIPESDLGFPCSYNSSISTITHSPQDIGIGPSGSCISDILASSCKVVQPVSSKYVTVEKPRASDRDDILSMFDSFTEENAFFITGNREGKAGICSEAIPNANIPELEVMLHSNYNGSIATSTTHFIEGIGMSPYESGISNIVPPPCNVLQLEAGSYATVHKSPDSNGGDILSIFDSFTDSPYVEENRIEGCLKAVPTGNTPKAYLKPDNKYNSGDNTGTHTSEVIDVGPSSESCRSESNKTEELDRFNHFGKAEDTRSMYEGLGDLGSFSSVIEDGYYFSSGHTPVANFLELGDLEDHGDLFGFN